jgi:hypothetical protein
MIFTACVSFLCILFFFLIMIFFLLAKAQYSASFSFSKLRIYPRVFLYRHIECCFMRLFFNILVHHDFVAMTVYLSL